MNSSTLLFLVLATACSTAYTTYDNRRCDDGLVYRKCAPCHLECEDVLSNKTCTKECRPGCACPGGKYWNGDECVTRDQCKRCPDYLVFHECRPCHLHCDDLAYNKTCTKECRPGCACAKDTYWNDDINKCVKKDQCPQDCPDDQYFSYCLPCVTDCKDLGTNKTCTKDCKFGCRCPMNQYWDGKECVHANWCPNVCPAGQFFTRCVGCNNCDDVGKGCPKICKAGCKCRVRGQFWNGTACVYPQQCPTKCPAGQVFSECVGCPNCSDIGKPCLAICLPGCKCPVSGQFWDGMKCVDRLQCPNVCAEDQVYSECVGCNKCEDVDKPCPLICVPGCKCREEGHFWDGKKCVAPDQCPLTCPGNQVFQRCPSCSFNCNNLISRVVCRMCISGCACIPGTYWNGSFCVAPKQCPNYCPDDQFYTECVGCNKCEDVDNPCPLICVSGCKCREEGHFWDGKKCVTPDQCPPSCPSNQVYQECPSCAFNCSHVGQNIACPAICIAGCACSPGSYWNGSSCVAPKQCPNYCPDDQVYTECVGCNKCEDVDKPCPLICVPGCKCREEGHFWDGTKCVAPDQCPPTCPGNQVFQSCPSCRFNCNDLDSRVVCRVCIPGCACSSGTYWNGSFCVAPKQCPNYCPDDQVYTECVGCNKCEDVDKPCPLICVPGCKCREEGHFWDGKKCVAPDQCPPICPSNQVYQECPSCAFNCSHVGQNVACPLICKPGCACSPGSYWNGSSCVASNQCPMTCPGDQVFSECVGCTKCSGIGKPCPRICKRGCKCPNGLYWNGMKCVPRYQCPRRCRDGMVHHECLPCASRCDDLDSNEPCFAICQPGCACPVGSYWDGSKCLTKQQCKQRCYDGLVYRQCLPCHIKCKDVLGNKTCTKECKPGCACANGTYWDFNKFECVTEDQCRTSCPYQQVWRKCVPCKKTCRDLDMNKPCFRICTPGCACPPGKFLDGHECVKRSECNDYYY